MKKNEITLLITGCCVPDCNVPVLAVKNPDERRRQYIASISYYIRDTKIENIVYCDNSNMEVDLALVRLAQKCRKNLEWLSFEGDSEKSVSRGKGYGEGEITEYAINHSMLIQKSKVIIKVTGRLFVKNINLCLLYAKADVGYFDFYKDRVDTRCFVIPKELYCDKLLTAYKSVDDRNNRYYEHVFFEKIQNNRCQFKQVPVIIRITGQSGSTGDAYRDGPLICLKKIIKNIGKICGIYSE